MRKYLDRPLNIKAIEDDGTFSGYGSVFDVVDSYKDIVLPGAFKKSLADYEARGKMPKMLWQHASWEPIGVWTKMVEDEKGLYVEGRLIMEVERAREAHALLKAGAVDGLSIGYDTPKGGAEFNEEENVLELKQINLWETSIVTFPANQDAMIDQVRHKMAAGQELSIREMEALLRDAGMSKTDAMTLLATGFTPDNCWDDSRWCDALTALSGVLKH